MLSFITRSDFPKENMLKESGDSGENSKNNKADYISEEVYESGNFKTKYAKKRHSYGVICVRYNSINNSYEVLATQKSYSNAFNEFINCSIDFEDDAKIKDKIKEMFTLEKRLILFRNYELLFYMVWGNEITERKKSILRSNKLKFQKKFGDNLEKIHEYVSMEVRNNFLVQYPKGRKRNGKEIEEDCATRELYEETGITSEEYKLIPDKTIYSVVNDDHVKISYVNKYFIAVMKNEKPKLHAGESGDVANMWFLRPIALDAHNEKDLYICGKKAIKIVKNLNRI